MYADGGGLYLRVTPEGAKIGSCATCSIAGRGGWGLVRSRCMALQDARARALDARRKRHEGIDPIEARRAERARQRLDAAKAITFKQCAEVLHRRAPGRLAQRQARGAMAGDACRLCLSDHRRAARAGGGHRPCAQSAGTDLDGEARNGEPLARAPRKHFGLCQGAGLRDGENPARWRGHLDKLLPARSKVREVEHHAALPYAELPAFLASLREQEGIAARALEFADPDGRTHRRSDRRAVERD